MQNRHNHCQELDNRRYALYPQETFSPIGSKWRNLSVDSPVSEPGLQTHSAYILIQAHLLPQPTHPLCWVKPQKPTDPPPHSCFLSPHTGNLTRAASPSGPISFVLPSIGSWLISKESYFLAIFFLPFSFPSAFQLDQLPERELSWSLSLFS